ncbi:uncharacterized protein TrAtP1_003660 [Trichoderma atroviride]|uniref:uncharacterized protein n=1 Tax=Hypocrea atroviridis TaxID=63577 RepID=UPI00332F0E6E|nr:hypothetical protein TrAtP1_003660 [Trichoderma atroviride]
MVSSYSTHTRSTNFPGPQFGCLDAIPVVGKTYIIRRHNSTAALCIRNEKLVWAKSHIWDLRSPPPNLTTWLVVEFRNWLGFFNESTGMYLGYNDDILLPVNKFNSNAYFGTRHGEYGGYALQAKGRKKSTMEVLINAPSAGGRLELTAHRGSFIKFVSVRRQI